MKRSLPTSIGLILFLLISGCVKDNFTDTNSGTFRDARDKHVYQWVRIGEQIWMAENLAYLPAVNRSTVGSESTPLYYVYGYEGGDIKTANKELNYADYGVLYNWSAAIYGFSGSAATPSGVQGICPLGWHLPSDDEWALLITYLDGAPAIKMKESGVLHWIEPNNGTNESGFSARPAGNRFSEGGFGNVGLAANFWSATDANYYTAGSINLFSDMDALSMSVLDKNYGFSVRCVKN